MKQELGELKVRQKVWTIHQYLKDGINCETNCEIVRIVLEDNYPIKCSDGENYKLDGLYYQEQKAQSLFLSNPFENNGFKEQEMMVSNKPFDKDNVGEKRVVFAIKNGKYIAWCDKETIEESKTMLATCAWSFAKEIEEPTIPEYTMEEVIAKMQEVLGHNFKIKKS